MANDLKDLLNNNNILTLKPDYFHNLGREFEYNEEVYKFPGNIINFYNVSNNVAHKYKAIWTNLTKADEYYLLNFFGLMLGRLNNFWLPCWHSEFRLYNAIAKFDDSIVIYDGFNADTFQGYERFFIETTSGDIITRHITSVIDNGDGTETLNLETLMDRAITVDDIVFFGRLLLLRFEQDELEMKHITSGVSTCDISNTFLEVPAEYLVTTGES